MDSAETMAKNPPTQTRSTVTLPKPGTFKQTICLEDKGRSHIDSYRKHTAIGVPVWASRGPDGVSTVDNSFAVFRLDGPCLNQRSDSTDGGMAAEVRISPGIHINKTELRLRAVPAR